MQRQSGQDAQRFAIARAQLRQVAVASYENGSQSSIASLLTAGDPAQILRQGALLQELGNLHTAQAGKFLAGARQVASAKQ